MLVAEETLENTFDFAHKLVRMKEPQEFARIQTEFFQPASSSAGRLGATDHTGRK